MQFKKFAGAAAAAINKLTDTENNDCSSISLILLRYDVPEPDAISITFDVKVISSE